MRFARSASGPAGCGAGVLGEDRAGPSSGRGDPVRATATLQPVPRYRLIVVGGVPELLRKWLGHDADPSSAATASQARSQPNPGQSQAPAAPTPCTQPLAIGGRSVCRLQQSAVSAAVGGRCCDLCGPGLLGGYSVGPPPHELRWRRLEGHRLQVRAHRGERRQYRAGARVSVRGCLYAGGEVRCEQAGVELGEQFTIQLNHPHLHGTDALAAGLELLRVGRCWGAGGLFRERGDLVAAAAGLR